MKQKITNIIVTLLCVNFTLNAGSISPIPEKIKYDKQKATLGAKLFNDKRLSKDNTISCATCHNLNEGGDDNLAVSKGINGKKGSINAPTVLNAVFNFRQFWDGRVATLKEQAAGPIEDPHEMGSSMEDIVKKLEKTEYKELFDKTYKTGITKNNLLDAIAEFEKTLITPNSAFDRYLKGQKSALKKNELEGFELFKSKGCISCHNGVNIGGNLYSKFGVMQDASSANLGRYNVTKKEKDKYYFKVPTLRNIDLTAPYFHDARTSSLKEAVKIMALYQLGRPISSDEVDKIVSFLKTLTAKVPKEYTDVLKNE